MGTTTTGPQQPPLGIRLMHALRKEPDWLAMPPEALAAFREAENRKRGSRLARVITGFPDRGATMNWQELDLPNRALRVRVYRPSGNAAARLPLVLHVHGGGFVGTAVQCDWVNSHLAARLPAVVVSVEHRLVDPETPLSAAIDDGWDALDHVLNHAAEWGIDPDRTAVFGESAGSMVTALAAIRARHSGLRLRAQVLVNPCVDLTSTAFDYPSMTEYADSPTLTVKQMEFFRRLAVPDGSDPRTVSPLYADDLSGLAPALVVVPTLDPVADHGRTYAARLRDAGTPVELVEHPGAGHAFLSMPGVVPQAREARTQIADFLQERLAQ
ncbi:alpha/beta hydrolase [Kribbella sp. NPDC026596]|uniref:alpha/beta hydrolase n=1 Tax=Kribbella sp. NPDC026596 TaxID=3155122 RepID=UPI00340951D0